MQKRTLFVLCLILLGAITACAAELLPYVDLRLRNARSPYVENRAVRWDLLVPDGFTGNLADYYLHLTDEKGNNISFRLDQVRQHGVSFDKANVFSGEQSLDLASRHPGLSTEFAYGLYGLVRVYFLPDGGAIKTYPPKHDLAAVFYQVPNANGLTDVAGVKLFGFARDCLTAYGTSEERKKYGMRTMDNFAESKFRPSNELVSSRNLANDTTSPNDGFIWVCLRPNATPVPTPPIIRLPLRDDCYQMLRPLPEAQTIDQYISATNFLYAKPLLTPGVLPVRKDTTFKQLEKLTQLQNQLQQHSVGNLRPDASWNFAFIEVPDYSGLALGAELFECYLTLIDTATPEAARLAAQLQADIDLIHKITSDTALWNLTYHRKSNDAVNARHSARGKPVNRPDLPIRYVKFGESPQP